MPNLQSMEPFRAASGLDPDYVSGVRKGFEGWGMTTGWDLMLPVLVVFLILLALLLALRLIFRPARPNFIDSRDDQIIDPEEVQDLILRSVDLRAKYDVEIHDSAYKEIYKGQVMGLNWDDEIEIELEPYHNPELDFREKAAVATFHLMDRGRHEFYQFRTTCLRIAPTTAYGRKAMTLRLRLPTALTPGQKRRHLRLRPRGRYAFQVTLATSGTPGLVQLLASLRPLHQLEVTDISVGGLQASIKALPADIRVRAGDEIFAQFRLPSAGLNLPELPPQFFVRAKVLTVERVQSGRRVMSRAAEEATVGWHNIRLEFIGRGRLDRHKRVVTFHPATALAFEDVARWIQSYQRRQIQEEKGTAPRPDILLGRSLTEKSGPEARPRANPKNKDAAP